MALSSRLIGKELFSEPERVVMVNSRALLIGLMDSQGVIINLTLISWQ